MGASSLPGVGLPGILRLLVSCVQLLELSIAAHVAHSVGGSQFYRAEAGRRKYSSHFPTDVRIGRVIGALFTDGRPWEFGRATPSLADRDWATQLQGFQSWTYVGASSRYGCPEMVHG